MTVIINGTTGITNVNGSAAAPAETGTDTDTGIVYGTNTLTLSTGGTAGLVQNASQNLAVGTSITSSAWGSGNAIDLSGNTGIWGYTGGGGILGMTSNTYFDGTNWRAKTTGASGIIQVGAGSFSAFGASSVSAGAVVTPVSLFGVLQNQTFALQNGSSTSGTGIAFPATQSASTDANTLDDYEEGTWTPIVNGQTITGQTCYYTKIGRFVMINGDVTLTFTGSSSGQISGLPFTTAGITQSSASVSYTNVGSVASFVITAGATRMDVYNQTTGAIGFGSGARFVFGGVYIT